ncbi:thioredoxin-like protein [Bisporella sp. PMI_857]|nr:thioredoxin-like protein [Bisporella sp. PMI_857]
MFRFHKTLDVITLFHKASSPASVRVQSLLKQLSATASEHATEDQASDHSHQSKPQRIDFELEVTEEPPTEDQLRSILEYLGGNSAGKAIRGAKDEADALRKLKANGDSFERPFTVNWSNGRAVAGSNESEILKLVEALPKGK